MHIAIPINTSFDCPEGTHTAIVEQVTEVTKIVDHQPTTLLRILFEVPSLSTESNQMLVGRNFVPDLHEGSQLRQFLETWLGEGFLTTYGQNGKFNSDWLTGKEAEIEVHHITNKGYKKPFVHLVAAYPPNSTGMACKVLAPTLQRRNV